MTDQESTRSDETNESQSNRSNCLTARRWTAGRSWALGGEDNIQVVEGASLPKQAIQLPDCQGAERPAESGHTLALEALKLTAPISFCVRFRSRNNIVRSRWEAGGTLFWISCINKEMLRNSTKWSKKFRTLQVDCMKSSYRRLDRCRSDDEVTVDIAAGRVELSLRSEVTPTTPIGIRAFETKSAWRNIRLTPHHSNSDSEKQAEPIDDQN